MKKRTVILLILIPLAAALFWYKRPVTMAGTLDTKNVISVEASLMTPLYIPQANGTIIRQEVTNLSASAGDQVFTKLLAKTENISSHASLAAFLFPNHPVYDQEGTLSISFRTEQDVTTFLLLHNSGYLYWENRNTCLSATKRVYPVDKSTFALLADFLKEYGISTDIL